MATPMALNEFTHQPSVAQLLVGLFAHMTSALPGIALGALFANPIVRRQGYTLGGVLLCLLLTVPADDFRDAHQGFGQLLSHLAPPALAVIRALGATDCVSAGRAAALLRPYAVGAAIFAVLAGAAYLRLARTRS